MDRRQTSTGTHHNTHTQARKRRKPPGHARLLALPPDWPPQLPWHTRQCDSRTRVGRGGATLPTPLLLDLLELPHDSSEVFRLLLLHGSQPGRSGAGAGCGQRAGAEDGPSMGRGCPTHRGRWSWANAAGVAKRDNGYDSEAVAQAGIQASYALAVAVTADRDIPRDT